MSPRQSFFPCNQKHTPSVSLPVSRCLVLFWHFSPSFLMSSSNFHVMLPHALPRLIPLVARSLLYSGVCFSLLVYFTANPAHCNLVILFHYSRTHSTPLFFYYFKSHSDIEMLQHTHIKWHASLLYIYVYIIHTCKYFYCILIYTQQSIEGH